ncbi:DUF1499 domain-containing protein [Litoreibacter halocynthiae]|uniref:DUF1499 domain-containing protein n=1 Tax=Litoreibacter halocynthiae TaxID=1242689 RepID=UPI002493B0D9|nr:DUF1499 domain-containing protein [Litoreibacter halocynthiae]
MLKVVVLTLLAIVIGFAAIVRLRPLSPDIYHVNLRDMSRVDGIDPGLGGHFSTLSLPARVDDIAMDISNTVEATPRTTLLAGSLVESENSLIERATFVTRSAVWGFPDVTTIEIETTNMGAFVRIYGRLVYGQSDFGVNKARIDGWIDQLYALPIRDHFGNPIKQRPEIS